MRIAMLASECEPFAKTGGLADVVDALSRALGAAGHGGLGHDVDVYLPWYRGLTPPADLVPLKLPVPMGSPSGTSTDAQVTLWSGPADGYRLRLVEHPASFDRDGLYLDADGDFPDNAARFALLGRTALEAMRTEARPVHIIHGHDWQAGPALLSLREHYLDDAILADTGTMLTCHNLAYHGWTPAEAVWQLGLKDADMTEGVDLLRAAILGADLVNTVSPTYARESLAPEAGGGLDAVLTSLGDRYIGILNGIDMDLWDPATDDALAQPYGADDTAPKAVTKAQLCERHGLDSDGPLLGVIGRLDPQKGFDLVTAAAPELVAQGARLIVLGTGDAQLISGLLELARATPDRVAVLDRFDRDEARRIYAGADLFLMPSRFEPCGQGQLIAMRYGTPPVVRSTGGLADTVIDADADPITGNGFVFDAVEPAALIEATLRGMAALDDEDRFAAIVRRGMHGDASWRGPALEYVAAYERVKGMRSAVSG
jgi:starch synthase